MAFAPAIKNPPSRNSVGTRILGLGLASPPFQTTQKNALDFVLHHFPLKEATRQLCRRVFGHGSVQTRSFALERLSEVLEKDRDKINKRFEERAAELSARSLLEAVSAAGISPRDLDFVAAATCTGYLCPGLSSHLVERAGLRRDLRALDLVGMGCGAALPALEAAKNFVSANPGARAAAVCTEICSAAMFSDDAADLVVSNAIFADGSAAAVLSSSGRPAEGGPAWPLIDGFASLTLPEWRDTLRFRTQEGYLRNVLGKDVPDQAAQAVSGVFASLLSKNGLSWEDIDRVILHAGGGKVLDALEGALPFPPEAFAAARRVLRRFGNMSSPTVLFVLAEELRSRPAEAGERALMASFGAGFTAHGALLSF